MFDRILNHNLPLNSFFLFGPRQVGKSTLIKQANPKITIDLLDAELHLQYNKNPQLLKAQIEEITAPTDVFIDEVQKVPALLDVIHQILEAKKNIRFILCGSSARKLRHGAANLLGGRLLYRTLHPLCLEEIKNKFSLERVLLFGSLPKIYSLLVDKKIDEARDFLRTYVTTYLREEIKAEALVRNLQGFQNFLDVASAQYGEQVNFSSISRDCQVALSTVKEFYIILEDTLIGFFLYPYLKSERKRLSHQPKFYFFDNGVTRALLRTLLDEPTSIEKGRLFEQWVIQEIYRLNAYYQKDWTLNFWRTTHGAEVDLIISRGKKILFAIECKYKAQIASSDISGLKAFKETHPEVPCFIVAPVKLPAKLSFVKILSPENLFKELTA